jgi:hypothetical protein
VSADHDPVERSRQMLRASERMVCEMLGHNWQRVRPKEGTPMWMIIGEHIICVRCGKLNR